MAACTPSWCRTAPLMPWQQPRDSSPPPPPSASNSTSPPSPPATATQWSRCTPPGTSRGTPPTAASRSTFGSGGQTPTMTPGAVAVRLRRGDVGGWVAGAQHRRYRRQNLSRLRSLWHAPPTCLHPCLQWMACSLPGRGSPTDPALLPFFPCRRPPPALPAGMTSLWPGSPCPAPPPHSQRTSPLTTGTQWPWSSPQGQVSSAVQQCSPVHGAVMGGAQCSRYLGQYGALCTDQCGFSQARGRAASDWHPCDTALAHQPTRAEPPGPKLLPRYGYCCSRLAPAPAPLLPAQAASLASSTLATGGCMCRRSSHTQSPSTCARQRCASAARCVACYVPAVRCRSGRAMGSSRLPCCRLPAACLPGPRPPTHHKPPCTAASPAFYCPATFSLPRIAAPTGTVLLPPHRPLPAT